MEVLLEVDLEVDLEVHSKVDWVVQLEVNFEVFLEVDFEAALEVDFEVVLEVDLEVDFYVQLEVDLEVHLEVDLEVHFEVDLEVHFKVDLEVDFEWANGRFLCCVLLGCCCLLVDVCLFVCLLFVCLFVYGRAIPAVSLFSKRFALIIITMIIIIITCLWSDHVTMKIAPRLVPGRRKNKTSLTLFNDFFSPQSNQIQFNWNQLNQSFRILQCQYAKMTRKLTKKKKNGKIFYCYEYYFLVTKEMKRSTPIINY